MPRPRTRALLALAAALAACERYEPVQTQPVPLVANDGSPQGQSPATAPSPVVYPTRTPAAPGPPSAPTAQPSATPQTPLPPAPPTPSRALLAEALQTATALCVLDDYSTLGGSSRTRYSLAPAGPRTVGVYTREARHFGATPELTTEHAALTGVDLRALLAELSNAPDVPDNRADRPHGREGGSRVRIRVLGTRLGTVVFEGTPAPGDPWELIVNHSHTSLPSIGPRLLLQRLTQSRGEILPGATTQPQPQPGCDPRPSLRPGGFGVDDL